MALKDDINNLPTAVSDGIPGHLDNHQVIHAALKNHESRLGVRHLTGTGSPQGRITAVVGDQYTDTASTNGAIRWVKTSGTGNSGWTVEYGDTGLRALLTSETEAYITSGRILVRRIGAVVALYVDEVQFSSTTPGFGALPNGFRGESVGKPGQVMSGVWPVPDGTYMVSTLGYLNFYRVPTDKTVRSFMTYSTSETWPTSLPGTPA